MFPELADLGVHKLFPAAVTGLALEYGVWGRKLILAEQPDDVNEPGFGVDILGSELPQSHFVEE